MTVSAGSSQRARSVWNSPGPPPARPSVLTCLPAASYTRSSFEPPFATTIRPSLRRTAPTTCENMYSWEASTSPMETVGLAATVQVRCCCAASSSAKARIIVGAPELDYFVIKKRYTEYRDDKKLAPAVNPAQL